MKRPKNYFPIGNILLHKKKIRTKNALENLLENALDFAKCHRNEKSGLHYGGQNHINYLMRLID